MNSNNIPDIQINEKSIEINWPDGHKSSYNPKYLRIHCGCAECVEEWSNRKLLDPVTVSEINRTEAIAVYQENIPNPFILDETLIYRAYFYDEEDNNEGTIGDVTGEGLVNVVDVVLIVNYIMNTQSLNETQLESADINTDGIINIVDIVALVSIIIGD